MTRCPLQLGSATLARDVRLTVHNHDRDVAGLRYVYPVVSRRAGGVSVGINLNPNNACNWRCIYCQVPDLVRGVAPEIDLSLLTDELDGFLTALTQGTYLEQNVEPQFRRIVDVALSGNGESTTAQPFDEIVAEILRVTATHLADLPDLNKVLITNGSMMHRESVCRGVAALGAAGGEVWFKLDAGTAAKRAEINGALSPDATVRRNLRAAAARCTTRIQTCLIARNGQSLCSQERAAYVAFIAAELAAGTPITDVLLYGMARPSLRQEAVELSQVSDEDLERFAQQIRGAGLAVQVRA